MVISTILLPAMSSIGYPTMSSITSLPLTTTGTTNLSQVRIRVLGVNASVGLDVPKGVIHEAAHAAMVAELHGTVDQLLLR